MSKFSPAKIKDEDGYYVEVRAGADGAVNLGAVRLSPDAADKAREGKKVKPVTVTDGYGGEVRVEQAPAASAGGKEFKVVMDGCAVYLNKKAAKKLIDALTEHSEALP